MTVTYENRINKRLATRVDSDIKELAKLLEAQQATESRRKKITESKTPRRRTLKKLLLGA